MITIRKDSNKCSNKNPECIDITLAGKGPVFNAHYIITTKFKNWQVMSPTNCLEVCIIKYSL